MFGLRISCGCKLVCVTAVFGASVIAGDLGRITPEEAGYSPISLEAIRQQTDALYNDGRIPNYVVALAKDGRLFYVIERGSTEIGGGQPVDLGTIYHMASMSKPLVSTAVFRLIQEGKLDFDTKLSKFFPAFKQMFVAPRGDFDSTFEEAAREITILDLLTHTSGLTYGEQVIGFGDVAKQYDELQIMSTRVVDKELVDHIRTLSQIPLVAHPGETFNYSVGIDVLGAVIEKVTGKRLSTYLDEILFQPLGMNHTGFDLTEDDIPRFARIYVAADRENPAIGKVEDSTIDWKLGKEPWPVSPYQPPFDSGGGGIRSTASDYIKYLSMIANGGEFGGVRVLSEEYANMQLRSLVPNLGLEAFEEVFGDAAALMTFGGGFGIKKDEVDLSADDYYFWGGIFNTFFWIDGDDRSVGIFLTHHYPVQYNIADQIEQIVDGARR